MSVRELEQGVVVSVEEVPAGDQLAADHPAPSTVVTNTAVNPSVETNLTSITGGNCTRTLDTSWAAHGTTSMLVTVTNAGTSTYLSVYGPATAPVNRHPCVAGDRITMRATVRGMRDGAAARATLVWYDAAGAQVGTVDSAPNVPVNNGQVVEVSRLNVVVPADQPTIAGCYVRWYVQEASGTTPQTPGVPYWQIDGFMVVNSGPVDLPELPAYFDGDTPATAFDTYAWTGTPHGSTSTRTTQSSALVLYDAVDFDEDGGQALLGAEVVTYSSADLDADTLLLAAPLTGSYAVDEAVAVYPDSRERRALVQLDLDGEGVDARVPHALYDRLAEGSRAAGERVSLYLDGGEWVVEDVLGQEPTVDGSYIDPDTLPPVEAGPTEPPTDSPVLTAVGSNAAITLVAEGIVEPTTVLDYYMNGVLVTSTRSTVYVVRTETDGDPLDPDLSYEFWVIAKNDLGSAAPSATASAALNLSIDTETVLAVVSAGFVLAGEIQVGNIRITPDEGIVIPLASGGEIRFPADGSPAIIDAILRTSDLAVAGGLSINGVSNYINGKVFLASGVGDPQALLGMDYASYRESRVFNAVTEAGTGAYGLARTADGTKWGAILVLPTGGEKRFVVIDDATGSILASVHSDTAVSDFRSCTAIGNTFFVLGHRWNSSKAVTEFVVQRVSTTGTITATHYALDNNGDRIVPAVSSLDGAIAADPSGTSAWISRCLSSGRVRFYQYTASESSFNSTPIASLITPTGTSYTTVKSLYVGSADFGAQRFVVGIYGEAEGFWVRVFNTDATPNTADSWTVSYYPYGLWWDASASRFVHPRRQVTDGIYRHYEYSPNKTDLTCYGQYTWYDTNASGGNKESAPSPINSRLVPKRGYVVVALPAPPKTGVGEDDPNAVRLYLDTDSVTKYYLTVTTGVAVSYTMGFLSGSGAAPPASSTFPAASATGELASASGTDYFRGTGAFNFGGIRGTGDGRTTVPDQAKISGFVPVGSMMMWTNIWEPAGWLICDGRAVSRTLYSSLWGVLGTTFGAGDTTTTFNLPDMRQRLPFGRGSVREVGGFESQINTGNAPGAEGEIDRMDHRHIHNSQSLGRVTNTTAGGSQPRLEGPDSHDHGSKGVSGVNTAYHPFLVLNFIVRAY